MRAGLSIISPAALARQALIRNVRAVFNDQSRGDKPVVRSPQSMFGPGSVIWRVHGDVVTMMVGGMSALLLQMLHPAVLGGVWDHSNFREDMLGRLRRTARFISLTTYASREDAEAAIARVRSVHAQVTGILPDGTIYSADDPQLLAWVHVTEALSFLNARLRYAEPAMPHNDQDRYFEEMSGIALALGADPVPRSRAAAEQLIETVRRQLSCDARTREVAAIVLMQRPDNLVMAAAQRTIGQAAVDLLPRWAQEMHGLRSTFATRPFVRAGTLAMAKTLRWAFR
jgi:uncharacterized protein (DUF2236 family)